MKKLILSLVVTIAFIVFIIYKQTSGQNNPVTVQNSTSPTSSTGSSNNQNSSNNSNSTNTQAIYKDGQYTGSNEDAFYGFVKVKATIAGGKITNVEFLDYPNDRSTSVEINSQAMPDLTQEAISAQSAQIDIVSGATDTSEAFRNSLSNALNQAQ